MYGLIKEYLLGCLHIGICNQGTADQGTADQGFTVCNITAKYLGKNVWNFKMNYNTKPPNYMHTKPPQWQAMLISIQSH